MAICSCEVQILTRTTYRPLAQRQSTRLISGRFRVQTPNVLSVRFYWWCAAMTEPYFVSQYLSRIEAAHLDILENIVPIDKTITLWWGLDGLRLNEDGTMEWMSRKKKRTSESAPYQPCQCQSIQPFQTSMLHQALWDDQTQCTRNRIEALNAAIQQCCVQYSAQYPPYYYGGCCGRYIG